MTDLTEEPSTDRPQRRSFRQRQAGGGPHQCPCCFQRTLENRASFDICPECGWEDDPHADEVWGGPNGSLSLSQARAEYTEFAAGQSDPDSVVHGGEGSWWAAAKRHLEEIGVIKPRQVDEPDTNR